MRHTIRPAKGYSLLEVLLTVALLGLLLFAVGDAVAHVLDSATLGESRQNVSRSAEVLASRLGEEARSSTAIFVPAVDVLGQPSTTAAGSREVDFFRKASDGTLTFVAYRFEPKDGSVARFEYVPVDGSPPQIIHQDLMAEHVVSFTAARVMPDSIRGIVGAGSVKPVNIYYGSPELIGGNGIVTVSVVAGLTGEPQRHFNIHLASRAAPTDVSVLVPAGSPPPSPSPSSTPITVGFLLKSNQPPHGPHHGGDPGDPGGGMHRPAIGGVATFVGNGSGPTEDWLSLYSQFNTVGDGIYKFMNSEGQPVTVTIGCDEGACPSFVPKPQPTTGPKELFYTVN
jgi:prepilin-type N-terminal cleavage/methylation domain-containing protein